MKINKKYPRRLVLANSQKLKLYYGVFFVFLNCLFSPSLLIARPILVTLRYYGFKEYKLDNSYHIRVENVCYSAASSQSQAEMPTPTTVRGVIVQWQHMELVPRHPATLPVLLKSCNYTS